MLEVTAFSSSEQVLSLFLEFILLHKSMHHAESPNMFFLLRFTGMTNVYIAFELTF